MEDIKMDRKLKCAVVGIGLLGIQHSTFLLNYPRAELVAICDIKEEKLSDFSNKHKEYKVKTYTDCKEMYKNENLDLVIVATQDPYHKEPVLEACRANLPYVICEKPFTTTISDANEIIEAAKESDTKIYVLFPHRRHPLDEAIHILVKNGYLGTPKYGELRADDNVSVPLSLWGTDGSKLWASISTPAYFLLSHAVDLLRFYFEPHEVIKVYAIGKKGIIGSDVDYVDGYLTFDNGLSMRLKSEWTKYMKPGVLGDFYVQLTGTNGGFVYNKSPGFGCNQGLRFDLNCKEEDIREIQKLLISKKIKSNVIISTEGIYRNSLELSMAEAEGGNYFMWKNGIGHYLDFIMGDTTKKHLITDITAGYYQVKVIDAMLKSIMTGKQVDISYNMNIV